MKKTVFVFVALAMLAAVFSACGTTEPEVTTETTAVTTEAEPYSATTTEASTEPTEETETTAETTAQSETEAATTPFSETTAPEPPAPPTPEGVWDGRDEFIIRQQISGLPVSDIDTVRFSEIEYSVSDVVTLETVRSHLSAEALTELEQPGSFGRGSHNCCLGDSWYPEFRFVYEPSMYSYTGYPMSKHTYIAAEEGKSNLYVLSEEGMAYIGKLFENVFRFKFSAGCEGADYTGWGEETQNTVEMKMRLNSLEGYGVDIVDSVNFTYDILDKAVSQVIYGCVSDGHITDGADMVLVEPNFSFTLADGRAYSGACTLGEDGKFTVDALYTVGENGETVFFDLAARESLGELISKFAVNGVAD